MNPITFYRESSPLFQYAVKWLAMAFGLILLIRSVL
jgi:hypothetical protein